ncbi:gem-associated protein 4 [Odontesthes bonariensis]|uniref:gem-associated protein 4 n=1 Tax=Odontesthes bonariensis TaxID=219752 RepID=UPI003F5804AA
MTLTLNKDSAVLQGAFLQADKLCHPSSLSSIQKADWSQVGYPILQAVRQICGQDEPNLEALTWKKRIVCAVWLKLLCTEAEEDVEEAWRENPFFSLLNSLPKVNYVVLLELVKSTAAAHIFSSFLLHLPQPQICAELERLTKHMMRDPTKEDDVHFFLEVWWELWKGQAEPTEREVESMEMMFANQFAHLSLKPSSISPQASKRLKLDSLDLFASQENTDVLHILLHALKNMTSHLSSVELFFKALSISLDAFYTSFLIDQEVALPAKEKLHILCKVISTRKNEKLRPELIQKFQRDLHASNSPSRFKPNRIGQSEALRVITELTQIWQERGFVHDSSTPSALQLEQSVQRVLTALDKDKDEAVAEKNVLRGLLKLLALPATDGSTEAHLQVTSTIISHRLEDYENFVTLFASETSWAQFDELWMECLEKNPTAFRQHSTLISLSSTLMNKLHKENSNISQSRKLMKIIADIFSSLSIEDKNKALAAMLRLSSRGFFGCSVPPAVTDGFEKELNMAFNCIIQGGGRASEAVSQGNLTTAVSLVGRVAFQNPEATLRSCCHSAVFNKGAFSLIAKILQELPGLLRQKGRKDRKHSKETGRSTERGSSLLCKCLQETVRNKSLSVSEKEQFLKFLALLMLPDVVYEGEEKRQSCLTPQEVVNTFILPNLSALGHSNVEAELSLQLLHTALSVDVQQPAPSPHWVLECSPFPLLYVLAQLYNQTLRCWEQHPESPIHLHSMDTKELLVSVLTTLGQVVGAEVAAVAPSSWSRSLFWLYNKMEELDWTVRFHLKPVWGQHFKNEVPSSLLAVCELPEQEWSCLDLPQYGEGTGLLAWMECCSVSDSLQSIMLSCLSLDQRRLDHVSMFSKGLLVVLTQTLPWCSVSQWTRLLRALRELITSGRLNVPFSLEYVDYLPLLDLRRFSCELRLSVLLLRVFQLLCGSSCSHWLSADGWAHVCRLYAHAVREMIKSLKAKLPLPSPGTATVSVSLSPKPQVSGHLNPALTTIKAPKMHKDAVNAPQKSKESHMEEEVEAAPNQEVLFVLSQLYCHVQHIQVMMPGGQSEPLFLCSLEVLSHYEAIMAAFPDSCSPLESDNTRLFFSTITDNLNNQEMKAVLQQKITQLV